MYPYHPSLHPGQIRESYARADRLSAKRDRERAAQAYAAEQAREAQEKAERAAAQEWPEGQLTRADLATMTPAEIVAAKDDGLLNTLLGRPTTN
jgi:hypothetical protein